MSGPTIKVSKFGPGFKSVADGLEKLKHMDVLVGIPQDKNSRPGEPIGNAALLYIHTNGSPGHRIPARPVIEPAINAEENNSAITEELKEAAKATLKGNPTDALSHLTKAGIIGSNAAKRWFFDPRRNWAPLRPATIRAKGSTQELIDSGSMRGAITSVVRQSK
jgi:hypothetical protein